jgi:hypothetical protein
VMTAHQLRARARFYREQALQRANDDRYFDQLIELARLFDTIAQDVSAFEVGNPASSFQDNGFPAGVGRSVLSKAKMLMRIGLRLTF